MKIDSVKHLKHIAYLLERASDIGLAWLEVDNGCCSIHPNYTPEMMKRDEREWDREKEDYSNQHEWLKGFISGLELFLEKEE